MSAVAIPSDAPIWVQALFARIDELEQQVKRRPGRVVAADPMITARQADVTYRLKNGTARATWERGDGRLKGQQRKGRSPTGLVLWLDRADCDAIWKA